MKTTKTFVLCGLLLAVTIPGFAQLTVAAPTLELLVTKIGIDQYLQQIEMVKHQIENVRNTYEQFQHLIRAEQRAINNLKAFKNIRSYEDFESWYNRQDRLERDVGRRIDNMGVEIGTTTYKITDIEAIPEGVTSAYADKFRDAFSEEERQKIWNERGFSPSNYVYAKTWGALEKKIADQILTKKEVINEDNMEAFMRQKEIADRYKYSDENLTEKEVLMGLHETALETNRVLRELHYDQAAKNEMDLARRKLEQTPFSEGELSSMWKQEESEPMFSPITKEKWETVE